MIRFPGFIDICTDIPADSWQAVSAKAICYGYTALIASPLPTELFSERSDVRKALQEPSAAAVCDYAKIAAVTPENIRTVNEWADEVPAALLDFSIFDETGSFARMNMLSRLFNRWPAQKPICLRGNENQIGSALFMGQIHQKKIHVCSVSTRPLIELISEARQEGISVTCDVHPLSLVVSSDEKNAGGMLKHLGTEDDRQALWQHFAEIDCFSSAGYISRRRDSSEALSIMLPLLFSMRRSEMLSSEDILLRCCLNPAKIFGVRLDPSTVVEIEDGTSDPAAAVGVKNVTLHGKAVISAGVPESAGEPAPVRMKGYPV